MFKPNDKLPITRHEKLETINVHMVRGRVHQLPAIQTVFAAIHRLFDFRFLQIEEFSRFGPFAPICEPLTNQAVSESVTGANLHANHSGGSVVIVPIPFTVRKFSIPTYNANDYQHFIGQPIEQVKSLLDRRPKNGEGKTTTAGITARNKAVPRHGIVFDDTQIVNKVHSTTSK